MDLLKVMDATTGEAMGTLRRGCISESLHAATPDEPPEALSPKGS